MTPEDRAIEGVLLPEERQAKYEDKAEKEFQGQCENELNRRDVAFMHLLWSTRQSKGWPDLSFVYVGVPLAIELKVGKNKPTPDQRRVLAQMQRNGVEVYVLRTFDAFLEVLENVRERKQSEK